MPTAEFLKTVICDAVIAPGFEHRAAAILSAKRNGRFLVLEANVNRSMPATERPDVCGVTIEQARDHASVAAALPDDGRLDQARRRDALVGMITARYTQSNSVAFVRDGAAIGIGAGQQNRVDCVRLAGGKAQTWWLRRHTFVEELAAVETMSRQDLLNWQIRFAAKEMTATQLVDFTELFGQEAGHRYTDSTWRNEWLTGLTGLTMVSDGYLPFRDNVEHAAAAGVSTIVEPGGSAPSAEVAECAQKLGITHVQTRLRLFRH